MIGLVSICATILLLGLLTHLAPILPHYREAKKLGLPILITPFSYQSPIWMAVGQQFSFLRHLPFGLGDWTQYSTLGWELNMKHRLVSRLGPAIAIVSPYKTDISIADHAAAEEILVRHKQYVKNPEVYAVFAILGRNLLTVDGKDWQRHRKITGPAFKESTNKIVWDEAVSQGTKMSGEWVAGGREVTLESLLTYACTLSINVLMVAGLGEEPERSDVEAKEALTGNHTMSYIDALRGTMVNLPAIIVLSMLKLPERILPHKLGRLLAAVNELKQYLEAKLMEGRIVAAKDRSSKSNMMSALVEANEAAMREEGGRSYLSKEEILGNFFVLNVAGFETTATTISFSLPLLATHPEIQEWAAAEVRQVLGSPGEATEKTYGDAFPLLIRMLAVMYETLRLYSPIQAFPRQVLEHQVLNISGKPYTMPPDAQVTINNSALNCDPSIWGNDALEWRPQRWIKQSATGEETFTGPPKGASFLPWAEGPRVCPGRKFSQVEFVAGIAFMLKNYTVEPARRGRETLEEARGRLVRTYEDCYFNFAPKVRFPSNAGLCWKPRE